MTPASTAAEFTEFKIEISGLTQNAGIVGIGRRHSEDVVINQQSRGRKSPPVAMQLSAIATRKRLCRPFDILIAALALGLKIRRWGVNSHGVYIVRETGEPAQNAVVILAGPAINLLCAALFGGTLFGILNLVMALMNLIPLANTDGRHLMSVLVKKSGVKAV